MLPNQTSKLSSDSIVAKSPSVKIEIEGEDLEMLHDLFMPDDIDAEQDIDSASLNT